MSLGSLSWARKAGGRLSVADRFAFAAMAVEAVLAARRRRRKTALTTLVLRPPPESPAVLAAAAFCAEVSDLWLINHCARTFAWGQLLAQRDGLTFDAELLSVTCMLHDLGLTQQVRARRPDGCFAVAGAEEAAVFASEKLRWADARCTQLAEAISLHMNLAVGQEKGVEAHLLHAGAGFDVLGVRMSNVPAPLRAEVLSAHPRLGQNEKLAHVCDDEAAAHPDTRLGFSFRVFGARARIIACPLDRI